MTRNTELILALDTPDRANVRVLLSVDGNQPHIQHIQKQTKTLEKGLTKDMPLEQARKKANDPLVQDVIKKALSWGASPATETILKVVKIGHASSAFSLSQWAEHLASFGVFLDFKLHDIPETMKKAVRHYRALFSGLKFLTIWGLEERSVKAALEAAEAKIRLPVVLSLTSEVSSESDFLSQAERNIRWGADAFIVPPLLLSAMRGRFGGEVVLISPGVRLEEKNDHHAPQTPRFVREQGADYAVVGRPIVEAKDPALALIRYLEALRED